MAEQQRKLRILQVNKFYHPYIGGIESVVRMLSREMLDRAEVQVLVCQKKGKTKREIVEGVPVPEPSGPIFPVRFPSLFSDIFEKWPSKPMLWKFIRRFRWQMQRACCLDSGDVWSSPGTVMSSNRKNC